MKHLLEIPRLLGCLALLLLLSCEKEFDYYDPDPNLFMTEVTAGIYSAPANKQVVPPFRYSDIGRLMMWVDRTERVVALNATDTLRSPLNTAACGEVAMWAIEKIRTGKSPSRSSHLRLRFTSTVVSVGLSDEQVLECAELFRLWWSNWLTMPADSTLTPIDVDPLHDSPYCW